MKTPATIKWFLLAGTSGILTLATANAETDQEKKDRLENHELKNEERKDNHMEKNADRKENHDETVDSRKENHVDKNIDRKENHDDKVDTRKENHEEKNATRKENHEEALQTREENHVDKNDAREMNHEERLQDRQANHDARIYGRGEFKERFQSGDRERIVNYFSGFRGNKGGLPPGLDRRWSYGHRLPEGWRDRLVPGFVVEGAWMSALEPIPYEWFPQLTVVPDTRLYWYGDRVIRVYEPTHEVADVVVIPSIHIDL